MTATEAGVAEVIAEVGIMTETGEDEAGSAGAEAGGVTGIPTARGVREPVPVQQRMSSLRSKRMWRGSVRDN